MLVSIQMELCKVLLRPTCNILQNVVKKHSSVTQKKLKEEIIIINSQPINYLKVGHGVLKVLCFPGFLGTIWSDFKHQIYGLDWNQFTIVAWDPPGRGLSRPPERYLLSPEFYKEDAETAVKLMKSLGFESFSLLGWSDGGISSMILAAKYPKLVEKLVIWGSKSFLLPDDFTKAINRSKDLNSLPQKTKQPLLNLYGEELLRNIMDGWYNSMKEIENKGGDICSTILKDIECPTLILKCDEDHLVSCTHPQYLLDNIKGSKMHHFPLGTHYVHLQHEKEFNEVVSKFLLE